MVSPNIAETIPRILSFEKLNGVTKGLGEVLAHPGSPDHVLALPFKTTKGKVIFEVSYN